MKKGKTVKKNTAIQDLLEWIERVEGRGIETLSVAKVKERIRERIPMEKQRLSEFYSYGMIGETTFVNTLSQYKTPDTKNEENERKED